MRSLIFVAMIAVSVFMVACKKEELSDVPKAPDIIEVPYETSIEDTSGTLITTSPVLSPKEETTYEVSQ